MVYVTKSGVKALGHSLVVAFSQIRTRVFENSSERKNYGIRGFKAFNSLGSFIG